MRVRKGEGVVGEEGRMERRGETDAVAKGERE